MISIHNFENLKAFSIVVKVELSTNIIGMFDNFDYITWGQTSTSILIQELENVSKFLFYWSLGQKVESQGKIRKGNDFVLRLITIFKDDLGDLIRLNCPNIEIDTRFGLS